MKKIRFILFFLSQFIVAQNNTDSLINQLSSTKNHTEKLRLTIQLADNYKFTDVNLMRKYAEKALEMAEQQSLPLYTSQSYLLLGNADMIEGDYLKALNRFIIAQNILESEDQENNEIRKYLVKTYGSMGIVFSEQSNYIKAQDYYYKAVVIAEKVKDTVLLSKLYNNLGVVYKAQNKFQKAVEVFKKASLLQEIKHTQNIGITYTNIGNSYMKLNQQYEALQYYQKAKESFSKNPDARAEGELYNNLGQYYIEIKEPNKGLAFLNTALSKFELIGDKFGKTDTYLYLSQYYLSVQENNKALQHVQKAKIMANETQVLEQKVIAEKLLSDIYANVSNPLSAYEHLKQYNVLKDSLLQKNNIQKLVENELNFEFEKQRMLHREEIEKKEIQIHESQKRNRLQLLYGFFTAILLLGLIYVWHNKKQTQKRLTLEKELAEYKQKALYLQMNPHFIFNSLGSISSFIVQNSQDAAVRYLAKFSKLMRLTLEYSKESLISVDNEIESLQNYLELEQLRFNQKFDFTITKSSDIEDDMAIPPLLLQPLVENAIIHGIAPLKEKGILQIHFFADVNSIYCIITDNGIGYHTSLKNKENSVQIHQSLAIKMIHNRLHKIQATTGNIANLKIEELTDSTGTKVSITLPVQFVKNKKL